MAQARVHDQAGMAPKGKAKEVFPGRRRKAKENGPTGMRRGKAKEEVPKEEDAQAKDGPTGTRRGKAKEEVPKEE